MWLQLIREVSTLPYHTNGSSARWLLDKRFGPLFDHELEARRYVSSEAENDGVEYIPHVVTGMPC